MGARKRNSANARKEAKKNVAFALISFALLKGDDCLSVQLPSFELPVQIPVQLLLELELNLLVQNVISAGNSENPLLQAPLDLKSYLRRW